MRTTLIALIFMGVAMNNHSHAGDNGCLRVVERMASQDVETREIAQAEALGVGPAIATSLRGVQTAEAEAIVANYDNLLVSSDKRASMAAVDFFSQHGALRFLSRSLVDMQSADVKLAAVRRLRNIEPKVLADELPALVGALESEDVYISGSEAATLHALYMDELTGLIASIFGESVPANQPLEKKVQTLLDKARTIKPQAATDKEK